MSQYNHKVPENTLVNLNLSRQETIISYFQSKIFKYLQRNEYELLQSVSVLFRKYSQKRQVWGYPHNSPQTM